MLRSIFIVLTLMTAACGKDPGNSSQAGGAVKVDNVATINSVLSESWVNISSGVQLATENLDLISGNAKGGQSCFTLGYVIGSLNALVSDIETLVPRWKLDKAKRDEILSNAAALHPYVSNHYGAYGNLCGSDGGINKKDMATFAAKLEKLESSLQGTVQYP